MPSRKVRAVIFDIGRVLVGVDVSRAMSSLATGLSLSPAELWNALEKDPRWPDWQEGRISPHDWYLHVSRRLGITVSFERFTVAWNLALEPKPLQDDAQLEKLSKKYRLALLSNTDPIHVSHMEANYSFFRFFPARIYSCTVGASKPNPLIYLEALRACKVRSSEAVYIDDMLRNVEAARKLGMAGIHYQSAQSMAAALSELGVGG
jgi:HAD superfamily hydrolase (TIGR01509 family)